MPFKEEQDAFNLKAYFRSGTRNADGTWGYSTHSCMEQFNEEFPNVRVPYKIFVQHKEHIVICFEKKHCLCKGKSIGRPTVLTEGIVDNLRGRMEQNPNKSVRKLSVQTGLSYGTCRKALKKNLKLHP